MIKFSKPKRNEYQQIADLVNDADQIYLEIYSPEEFKKQGCSFESVEGLIAKEKDKEYLCAYNKANKIIGFASFYLKNPQTMWLSMIFVDTSYQKQGVGSDFIKKIKEIAKLSKALVLVFETDIKAVWAVEFYKKNNYQILSDEDLKKYPFDKALNKKQVQNRYVFGKII